LVSRITVSYPPGASAHWGGSPEYLRIHQQGWRDLSERSIQHGTRECAKWSGHHHSQIKTVRYSLRTSRFIGLDLSRQAPARGRVEVNHGEVAGCAMRRSAKHRLTSPATVTCQ